jgi:iron complex outermembrane recepter protein
MRSHRILAPTALGISAAAMVALPCHVMAQGSATTTVDTAAPNPDTAALAEVVVTAEKRSENLQKTPAAVTVVTSEQLVNQRVVSERDLEAFAPSADFSAERQNTVAYIRGVGTANDYPNSDPSVVMQVDQVYTPRSATSGALFDISGVEILPGPQGTLYGRNAIGGVINVTTNRPAETFSGEALIEAGDYSLSHEFAAVNMPLADDLAVRLAANREQHTGYLSNGMDDEDSTAFRVSALYTPGAFSAFLAYSYYHNAGLGDMSIQIPYVNSGNPWYAPTDPSTRGAFDQHDIYQFSGTFDYKFDNGMTLTYIPSWVYVRVKENVPQNGNDPPTSDNIFSFEPVTQYTQELRLAGGNGPLKWVGGLYGYYSNTHSYYDVDTPGLEGIGPFTNVTIDAYNREESYAAFTQVTYSVTDRVRVIGGLRYSSDEKQANGDVGVTLYPPITPVVVSSPASNYTFDHTWHHVDWKVGMEADLTETSMLYSTIASGYLEGGYSLVPSTPTFNNTYQPEKLIAYTLGLKNRFFNNRLEVNDELFYYDYRDYQVSYFNITLGTSVNYNAQKARIYGNDLSVKYLVSRSDEIDASIGLLSAYATDFAIPTGIPGQPPVSFNGYRLPDSPTATATVAFQHAWDLPNGSLIARVQTHYDSGEWEIFSHPANTYQPATTKTDVNLTYGFANDKWNIGLWGKNLENKARFVGPGTTSVAGINSAFLEAPRTYGVRVGARF